VLHVISLPTEDILSHPKPSDFHNWMLCCIMWGSSSATMYDDSLVPVALVNKLVSLANHPSARILQKFAKKSMANGST